MTRYIPSPIMRVIRIIPDGRNIRAVLECGHAILVEKRGKHKWKFCTMCKEKV